MPMKPRAIVRDIRELIHDTALVLGYALMFAAVMSLIWLVING